jgi:hypothetical protein
VEKRKEGRGKSLGIVTVFIVVDLGNMLNLNPLILVKICELNRLSRGSLLEVNIEINYVHILKTVRLCNVFIEFLGYLSGLNNFCHC